MIGGDVASGVVCRVFHDRRSDALRGGREAGFTTWRRAGHAGSPSLQVNIDRSARISRVDNCCATDVHY